jgi:SNF2 family DNA or RNA helicase
MQIVNNAALKLQLPPSITNVVLNKIEKSALINEGSAKKLLVNWEHNEAELLATCLDSEQPNPTLPQVPSPMLRDYDWPGLYTPFDHQKVTASYVSIRKKAFVFNEAGTGKTSAVIWAADYLMRLGIVKRVLVICPLSIMYSAWRDDIFKTAMHRTSMVAHGERDKRAKIIQSTAEFVIINFDGVNIVSKEIYDARFDLIIVDEANAYKTATTKRWKTLAKLVNTDTRLWMMTGTPASQSPVDAFGLARLVSPNRVPKYVTAWKDKVMYQVTRFKWVPKIDAQKSVFTALQPAIRFTKKECLDLPDLTYQTREVPISPQVAHYYNTLKKQFLIEAAGAQISAVNAAASLSKLLQISGGAVYTDKKDILDFDISPRLNAMMEVVDETVNKVVVFVPYLHTIEPVSQHLRDNGISTEVIKGEVSAKERAEIIGRFQTQANPRVLVIQPQSASHGITLTAADTMIFWSPVMSVETYIQCIGRIDRVGQKNKMTVVHLQSTEAERKVYTMLRGKVDSHLSLVDLYKQELDEV